MRAQQHSTISPGFSTTVKVVNLLAIVRNSKGQLVTDLKQEDFLLDEEGKPQTIRYFSRESDLPLTLGLLVDTSLSERDALPSERTASFRFLDKLMREDKDTAFVVHFDHDAELLQDLTGSKADLRKALDQLEIGNSSLQRRSAGGGGAGRDPARGGHRGAGTVLYDAVFLSADEVLKRQQGRKAVVVLSDGMDNGSRSTLANAIESAQRSDLLVYSILFEDPGGSGSFTRGHRSSRGLGEEDGHKVLQRLSRETGGRYFEVSKRLPIDQVYQSLEEELRSQYSIGYTPDTPGQPNEYRRVHLSTRQKSLIVQTREGYYPA
ncbi:MAG: VWA domain-containing protein [Ignavibacteriota bacterium]